MESDPVESATAWAGVSLPPFSHPNEFITKRLFIFIINIFEVAKFNYKTCDCGLGEKVM